MVRMRLETMKTLKLVSFSNFSLGYQRSIIPYLAVCFLFLSLHIAYGQAKPNSNSSLWNTYPLPNNYTKPEQARLQAGDTLQLPFWDDFSSIDNGTPLGKSYAPSPRLWIAGSETVRINTGLNIDPPSVGVATFDGVDAFGNPYSSIDTDVGLADSLISKPINLASVSVTERESVWFSFFWQQFGLGEFPDQEDSIRLQFKNVEQEWITVWLQAGGDSLATSSFQQEIIQLLNPGYFHDGFQFRFQSFSRLSGAFDTWNIDYIYLNQGRSASNTAYLDRALTSLPTSPLGQYTAVPMSQFAANRARYFGSPSVGFYNLNVQLQPVRFTALVRDAQTRQTIQVLNDDVAVSPIPVGFDRRTLTANAFDPNSVDTNKDSVWLETEFHLTSGDTVLANTIDFRLNDTVRFTTVIEDYYAYDDGEAEFGVELNLNGGKLAYQFFAPQRDLLTHLDIYFPPLRRNQQSTPIRLIVWKTLTDTLGNEVIIRSVQAQASSSGLLNEFTRIELSSPVVVEGTFYIGYEQQGDSFLAVGFDKNTNTSDKIFFNVLGAWDQSDELVGSLMLRPVFDRERRDIINSIDEPIVKSHPITVYPNPASGSIRINQPFERIKVMSLRGRLLCIIPGSDHADELIELDLPKGVYLINIVSGNKAVTKKLIVY